MKNKIIFLVCAVFLTIACEKERKHSINSPFHSKNVILLL